MFLADQPATKPIQLTLSEFLILEELLNHQGEHLTKQQLLKAGWPNSYVCDNALNMVIMSLRKKLLRLGGSAEIKTIYRVGYSISKLPPSKEGCFVWTP